MLSLLGVVVIMCLSQICLEDLSLFFVLCEGAIWVYWVLGVEEELSWCAAICRLLVVQFEFCLCAERLAVSLLGVACYSACITKCFGLVRVLIHYFC